MDPFHLNTPVIGDEQIFDVELDRHTELFTNREGRHPTSWDITDNHPSISEDGNNLKNGANNERAKVGDEKEAEAGQSYFCNYKLSRGFFAHSSYLYFVTSILTILNAVML